MPATATRARAARSPGMIVAQRMFAAHRLAEQTGIPADEILSTQSGPSRRSMHSGSTRRELLIGAGAATAAAALGIDAPRAAARARHTPRIAIVGAGLAGLRCAHLLWTRHRVPTTLYEAHPDRAGGRCWTLRDFFSGGLISEHGGSFLNTGQHAVRNLATQLKLEQEVVSGGDLATGQEVYFVGGRLYTYAEANADWHDVGYPAFRKAARESNTTAGAARLDRMSCPGVARQHADRHHAAGSGG